ncbi:hypothetical protein BOX15_Mlig014192g2 [Macrostomum lignano]|uniref:EF-hand domain-containing protein n=1 Tax=Macrostomum lignano TaxID=282301 RepID=A0A267F8E8_9PLAT|nr:hypothetical protein BOX15_Mlig014192g2 [Macrostomum lignano]
MMQLQKLLNLALLLAVLLADRAHSSDDAGQPAPESDSPDSEDFTPEQLAKARSNLDKLFDEKLDANRDGKVSRQELIAWLAEANRQQAARELDETWQAYNLTTDGADSFLDWDSHAARRAASVDTGTASGSEEEKAKAKQQQQAEFQAEVKRAIDEASKETGIDKAGINVGVPQMPPPETPEPTKSTRTEADGGGSEAEHQHRLAVELGRDRRRWEAADEDGDGRLNRREFAAFALAEGAAEGAAAASPAMRRVLALEAMERLDSDGDGRVSLAEFLAGAPAATDPKAPDEDAKNFKDVWDVNKDGYMDAEEMEKMLDYVDSAGPAHSKEAEAEAEAAELADEADRLMKTVDSNLDGGLSKDEVLARLTDFAGSAATDYGSSIGIHDEL